MHTSINPSEQTLFNHHEQHEAQEGLPPRLAGATWLSASPRVSSKTGSTTGHEWPQPKQKRD
eukprot:7561345-Prorocentrum_lima.AAC.1